MSELSIELVGGFAVCAAILWLLSLTLLGRDDK